MKNTVDLVLTVEWYNGPLSSDEQLTCFICGQDDVDGEIHFQGNGTRFIKGIHEDCRLRTTTLQQLRKDRRDEDE